MPISRRGSGRRGNGKPTSSEHHTAKVSSKQASARKEMSQYFGDLATYYSQMAALFSK